MKHLTKTFQIPILIISAVILLSATLLTFQGSVSGQNLENAAECGADIKLKVDSNCDIASQVQRCKANTRGTPQQKEDACNPQSSIEKLITTILNVFSAIVGSVAVIMVIIGGFKYVTSSGDSNAASSARNTVLFAVVGLIIVVFAQIIVRFVLQKI